MGKLRNTIPPERPEKEVMKRMAAMIAKDAGFSHIQPEALDILTNVAELYLENLAFSAKAMSEHANRSKPNINDVERSLGTVGLTLEDIELSATKQMHLPQLELLEALKNEEKDYSFIQTNNPLATSEFSLPEAPSHLPPLPSEHSFKSTSEKTQRLEDKQTIREKNAQQTRIVEDNLKKLLLDQHQTKKARLSDEINGFLDKHTFEPSFSKNQSLAKEPLVEPGYLSEKNANTIKTDFPENQITDEQQTQAKQDLSSGQTSKELPFDTDQTSIINSASFTEKTILANHPGLSEDIQANLGKPNDENNEPFINYEMSKFYHIEKGSTIKSSTRFTG